MTISLVAVFIPVLFMGGIVGRLLHEFSVTIAVAILISGFVSLTLDADAGQPLPALQPHTRGTASSIPRSGRRLRGHGARVRLHAEDACCAISSPRCWSRSLLLVGTVYLFVTMPTGFIPSQDSGFMFGVTHGRPGHLVRFHGQASARSRRHRCRHDPERRGPSAHSCMGGNQGFVFADLKPRNERALAVDQIIEELRPKLAPSPAS